MSGFVPAPRWRFNTWHSDYPAAFLDLPSGLRVQPCAYSDRAQRFTAFAAADGGLRLGPRSIDGARVALDLELAGTRVALACARPSPTALTVDWQVREHGEWGLRFWLLWTFGAAEDRRVWRYDPGRGLLTACLGDTWVAVLGERPPLLATFHDTLAALGEEFEREGYWYLASRGTEGRVPALRFNLEETPASRLAVALAADEAGAERAVREALAATLSPLPSLHTGASAGALDAVRDVIGWNTVHDAVNDRPYTALSRNWSARKFGGFGVWLDDVFYHALLAGALDLDTALANLDAVLAHATEAGNLPCLVTGRDAWVDRSQPPVGAFVVWLLYLQWGERSLLERCYAPLLANHEWWWRERDGNGNGLLEFGTSPVGAGLYRGTALAARNESSMDNSPTHDEARLVSDAGTLDCEDVGLNSLVALDGEMLARMARVLDRPAEAQRLEQRTEALRARIRDDLWDPERAVFANRLWSGRFVRSLAPTSFYPLLAGAANDAQRAALLALLDDETRFGGAFGLPSVSRDDPAYDDNVYWRGRAWPPLNFLVYHGLRRCGANGHAARLAAAGQRMFDAAWSRERQCAENYNAATGAVTDQPDTDTFYGWGALLPWLAVAEIVQVDPWSGDTVLRHPGEALRLGPLRSALGEAEVVCTADGLSLALGGTTVLSCHPGRQALRLRRVTRDLEIEIAAGGGGRFEIAAAALSLDGDPAATAHGGWCRIDVAARDHPRLLRARDVFAAP